MTPLKLPSGEYLLVKVPEGQRYFDLYGNEAQQEIRYNEMPSPGKFKSVSIKLPPGSWQLIGHAKDVTEEQAREICEVHDVRGKETFYKLYGSKYGCEMVATNTALQSFHSLLKANGYEVETTVMLLKK